AEKRRVESESAAVGRHGSAPPDPRDTPGPRAHRCLTARARQGSVRGMSRRITRATASAALVALTLGACAPSADSPEPGAAAGEGCDGDAVTLDVWSWRTEDVKTYERIFDVFEE